MLLLVSYSLVQLAVPALMALPFYFLNKFLVRKMKPRESAKNLLLYFITVILSAFVYISIGVFLIVWVGVLLK